MENQVHLPNTPHYNKTPLGFVITGLNHSLCVCVSRFILVRLFATPWTVAHQVPLSMGVFRQEHWSGLSFSSPEDLPDPGIKPTSPLSPALPSLPAEEILTIL